MRDKNEYVIETLHSIVSCAIEYDLHNEPNRFIVYIDLYGAYLKSLQTNNEKGLTSLAVPATFEKFVFNQYLLDEAALFSSNDSGEPVIAPEALQVRG